MPSQYSENRSNLCSFPIFIRGTSMEDCLIGRPTPDQDYADFFRHHDLRAQYPELTIPPASFVASGANIIAFEKGKSITLTFPVREDQTNPIGSLQGGVLASFIDDAFGTLSFASTLKPCVSIDMHVNFIRPAKPGEFVKVKAEFKARGAKLLHLYAEVVSGKGKLIATASSNMLILDSR